MDTNDYFVYGLIGFAIGLVIFYFATRFVFSVDKRLKQNAVQINLLSKIAEKLGVDQEELTSIKKDLNS